MGTLCTYPTSQKYVFPLTKKSSDSKNQTSKKQSNHDSPSMDVLYAANQNKSIYFYSSALKLQGKNSACMPTCKSVLYPYFIELTQTPL